MNAFSVLLVTILLFPIELSAQPAPILDEYTWKNRVILLFTRSEETKVFHEQLQEFEERQSGLVDRDLVVFKILPDHVIAPDEKMLDQNVATHLRNAFQAQESEYKIVLIGKDGGQKLSQDSFLSTDKLFGIIDQMPMRRREMREDSD